MTHLPRLLIQYRQYLLLLLPVIIVYGCGWGIPLMEVDAVQYANISRDMAHTGSYLEVYDSGADYLDKPPMLFWLSALSIKLLGVSAFAYRLPSFCFALIALYSCYRLCRMYYNSSIAWMSTLVLATSQALFLVNHDVRTDTMLMGWVTLSLWQLAAWYQSGKWHNFLLATLAIAGGIMTKGPIALMIPVFAFVPHFLLRRQWRNLFRWEYLLMLVLIALLLTPVLVGLYRQFDLHPEKVMYGQRGISGVRFFLWTQSFGRITGESTWHEFSSFSFLFENMLWSFMPWILFFIPALISAIGGLVRRRFRLQDHEEAISTAGFVISYCALASSQAQLPHYIFVVFPLAAIITGRWLYTVATTLPRLARGLWIVHLVIFILLWLLLIVLLYYSFPEIDKLKAGICLLAALSACVLLYRSTRGAAPLLRLCALNAAWLNLLVNLFLYPALLQYQPSVPVSAWLKKEDIRMSDFYTCQFEENRSLSFSNDYTVNTIATPLQLPMGAYCLVNEPLMDSLPKDSFRVAYQGESMHITMLTLPFLNPATRAGETGRYYIIYRNVTF